METVLILLAVIFIALAIATKAIKIGKQPSLDFSKEWPYYKKTLLTKPEQVLYFKLAEALPDFLIFAQVQLSQILGVRKGNDYYEWYNKINRMSADFVICNKSAEIIAVIELDDATHSRDERKEADRKKDKACKDAGIKIIRWNVKSMPEKDEIIKCTIN